MKLELKNIDPYLPYGLKCKYIDEDKLYTLDAEITETNQDKRLLQLFHVLEKNNASSCKIILRPLSDLTKEIEVNGEKFVPIERLKLLFPEYPLLIEDDSIFFTDRCNLNMLEMTQINEIFQKLYELHFNVLNLPEELWVNINSIQ